MTLQIGSGQKSKYNQHQISSTGAVSTTATAIPSDDTIPQSGEGAQITTVSITPTNANSRLIVFYWASLATSTASDITLALFKDAEAGARDSRIVRPPTNNDILSAFGCFEMAAGGTSAITFKLRGGAASGTTTFNGSAGARKDGGVLTSGILVAEILP